MEENKSVWEAYQIVEFEEGKALWNRVGTAFLNRDNSINVLLNAFPKDGKIQLRHRSSNNRKTPQGGHP